MATATLARPRMPDMDVRMAPWMAPFLRPARYKSSRGGRGAGRSHGFGQMTILRMRGGLPDYPEGPVRIACARQFQVSISESVKQVIEGYIKKYALQSEFAVKSYSIDHKPTGSHVWFPGFDRHPESLMSAEGVDVLWVEQAETVGNEMEKIVPTIRKAGSELWYSWNPTDRMQWCWNRFVANPRPGDVSVHVNYDDNPWFPAELEAERLAMLAEEPDRYPHVYLGEPDDADADKTVLPYSVLAQCVHAWREGLAPPQSDAPLVDGGLDLAEGGADKCSLVIRRGPVIEYVDTWPGVAGDLSQAAMRAHEPCRDWDAYRLYYDASSPIRTEFARLDPPYAVRPINFGGEVGGAEKAYESRRPNGEVFSRRNIQMADALRLRANRTVRLLGGAQDVDPAECLFIRDDIPQLETFLAELSAPIRRVNPTTGKWELDKRGGDENAKSPDRFDAACLAFSRDSDNGLRAR